MVVIMVRPVEVQDVDASSITEKVLLAVVYFELDLHSSAFERGAEKLAVGIVARVVCRQPFALVVIVGDSQERS